MTKAQKVTETPKFVIVSRLKDYVKQHYPDRIVSSRFIDDLNDVILGLTEKACKKESKKVSIDFQWDTPPVTSTPTVLTGEGDGEQAG